MQTILKTKGNVFNETNCKIIQKDWQCTLQKSKQSLLMGMKLHRVKTRPTRGLVKTRKTFKMTNDMISPPIGKNFEKTP